MDEVDAACPNVSSDYDTNSFNGGKRKLGIFLTGAAAGSVAAGLWTYSDLKNEPDLPMMEEGRPLGLLQAAQVINDLSDEGKPSTPTRRERFNFIADVVAETGPVLVYIEIKDLRVRDYFTGQPTTASNGSGFVVQKDGLILTNAHVVAGKPRAAIQVRLQDGRTFIGTVEDIDMKSDLATVRIPCKNLPVMKLGKSSNLRPGEFVIAMGSPLALSNTITTGVVSSVARNKKELGISRGRDVPDYIQTDAAITFGNSGGPLINLDGEAIGINSLKITPGISFAIPIDYAKEFLQKSEQRRRSGWPDQQIQRRYMGITMLAISPQIIEELRSKIDIPPHIVHGIVVFRIVQGSPADRAGLQPGDIITHINGIAIHKSGDVYELLESTEDLHVTLSRKNSTIQYIVKPED
jgi:HtrA serine peptidase 2